MSADANQEQTQTETPVTETPAAQPDTQGSVSPSQTPEPDAGSAQQAQGANSQHNNDFVPRWRLNEEIQKRRELESRFQTQPQQQPAQPQQKPENGAPKPEDFGDDYQAYQDARAAWIADQRYEQRRQQEAKAQEAKSFQERVKKADESFSEKLYDAATKNPALLQKLQNAPTLRPDLQLYGLKEADNPVAVAEYLADNPALVIQLNQLPPEKALREMGKIEAKLAGSSGQPVKKPSAGIPALDAVGAGNKPGNKSADQLSQDDVIARLYPTS